MTERTRPAPHSCNCGRRWDGYDQAHCAAAQCHRHFGSVAAFDLHRVGPDGDRRCIDPAAVAWGSKSKHSGKPRLKAVDGPHGVTWVSTVQNSRFGAQAGPGDAATGIHEQARAYVDDMFRRAFGHGP